MQLVIAFIILASLAIRNAQVISGGNWVDPDPADLDSLNIYYCEDLSPGDTIMTLLDSIGIGSTFGITIQDADANSVFEVVGSDLKIKTDADNAIYDFEGETDIRNFSVTLTFTNGPTVVEITAFLVAEDVNEFSPTFGESSYEVSVSENISQDASVLQVNATDDDGTSSISYQILDGGNSTYFSIDPDTGLIIYTPDAPLGDLTEVEILTFQVQAIDGNSSDSLNGNTTVVVKFLPVPEFMELNTVQDVHVNENTVGGIYTVNYTAAETVIYQLTLTNQTCEPPYFELNENEVVTAANQILDKETSTDPCTLTFRLSDVVHDVLSATLTVYLVELNDNAPEFSEYNPERVLPEHLEVGAEIYTAQATDVDIGNPENIMIYSLDGEGVDMFSINSSSGVISLAASLDYTTKNDYNLTLTAADTEEENPQTTTTFLHLTVITGPKFQNPEDGDTITIAEVDTGDGTLAKSLTVVDEDGDAPEITLESQNPDDIFELSGNDLIWKKAVNVDVENAVLRYTVTLKASDDKVETNDDQITFTINLEDSNDELPVFVSQSYSETVGEHLSAGATVLTVEANDRDVTEEYSQLEYSLTSEDGSHTYFNIDTDTGDISVAQALDYTAMSTYNLTAVAKDISNDPKSSTVPVTITVATGPKFQIPEDGDTITIAEVDTGDGTLATRLTVVDEDGDTPGITMESQNPDDIFELSGNDIYWKQAVDFDDNNAILSYTVTLKASDGNGKTIDDQITITITLEDSNDELPVFVSQSYSKTINEHLSIGATVLTVEANDRDVTEEYSQLKYSLTSEDGSHTDFNIDTDTGVISVAKALDYTAMSTYNLTVVAKDISNDPKNSTVPVTITVATGPVITSPQDGQKFMISEDDTENGNPVVTIEVTDEDENGMIALEVISQTPETEPFRFEINPNGQLVPKESVNADPSDEDPVFTLQIRASDARPYSTDHTITVTVQVYDSNEAPYFPKEIEIIEVPERTEVGTIVYVANASDPDKTSVYRPISYTLSGSRDNFKIFDNGSLVISAPLDYTRARTHDLTIRARNIPESMLYTTMHLIIYVLTAPEFVNLKESFTVEIAENKGGENVFDIQVNDKDGQERGTEIVTSIESQNPSMKLILEGLSLKTIEGGLDAEEEQDFFVTLKADDTEFETYSAQLKVKVIDLNDNSPVIEDVEDITIDENKATSGSGSEIVLVEATDGDATAANNMLTWTIISGNDDNYFAINPTTGMLSLVKTPVSQVPLEYTLTVEVADNGSPQNKETTSFTISINGEAVDECAESPCQNGGDCTSYTNTYICDCADGFEGDNCEFNIDDCDPCDNGGICSDGVNSFSCNCAEGWTGDTCLEECNNNKYGRNCANTCDCDGTRLASDAGNQACDVKNGDCKCNEFWRGSKCENDINECAENLHNCNDVPNTVCRNVNGSFSCICKTKHTLVNNVCKKDPPRSVRPKDGEVAILLRLKLELPCPNLNDPEVYREEENKIIIAVMIQLKRAIVVFVVEIWCGSIEFETTIIANDTADDRAELANEIQKIRDASSIQYGGNDVPVLNVFVNDKELLPTSQSSETMETKVCEVFTSYTSCSTDEECRYEDGKPTCLPPKKDNLALILGLGLGLTLPLLCLAFLAVVLWNMKRREGLKRRRWERKMMSSRDGSFATRYYDNGKYSGSVSHLSGFSNLPEEAVVTYPYKFNA